MTTAPTLTSSMRTIDSTRQRRPSRSAAVRTTQWLYLSLSLLASAAHAQGTPVVNPYDQTRSSSFTYFDATSGVKNGLLKTETVELNNAQLCVTTTYDYDRYGNKSTATTANCGGASGVALFAPRTSGSSFVSQTANVPSGAFPATSANALNHSETKTYDPRFGAVLTLIGPNSLPTTWEVDDFGRKTRELRADGTSTRSAYCYITRAPNTGVISVDTSATSPSSSDCPTPVVGEVPADAYMFVQAQSLNTAGTRNGPLARSYTDRAGRTIRTVSEAFDGANQPLGTARLIVQDTEYSPYGPQTITTQPYFLDTQSSASTGTVPYGMSRTDYDLLGRPIAVYTTDPATASNAGGSQPGIMFGNLGGNLVGPSSPRQAAKTSISYYGLTTTTLNDKNQPRTEEKNVDGKVVRTTDAFGAQVAFQHDAFGSLVVTKDALQNQLVVSYDQRGRKVDMADPDTGLWKYDYDALGQLVWQQSANQRALGQITTMAFDALGRMKSRTEPEYISTWSYDTYADGTRCMQGPAALRGAGKLCESNTSNGVNRKVLYDALGRPLNSRTSVTGGPSFASAVVYDSANGRLASQVYPTGLQVNYGYTTKGFLSSLTLATAATVAPLPATSGGSAGAGTTLSAGTVLWAAVAYNAWGKAEQQTVGSGVTTTANFDAVTGRLLALTAGAANTVLNQAYAWNSLGQLTQRNDANGDGISGAVSDSFSYDTIGRLEGYAVSSPAIAGLSRSVTLKYNALGMVLSKSDVGNYTYGTQNTAGVKPHALVSVAGGSTTNYTYDANGNLTAADGGKYRSITYTSFNLPDGGNGMQGPSGSPKYPWQYDENHQRIKETQVNSAGTRTTWNLHPDNQGGLGFESESSTANPTPMNRHYLSVGGNVIGVLVSRGALPALTASQMAPTVLSTITLIKVEFWHKDQLGSLITTTDHAGAVTARYAYDPFGKRRQASGTYDSFGTLVVDWTTDTNKGTDRGYTGHEHLDDIGVIHMNGRIFDPTLGRFMQGDPLIQDPGNLQNYDRYGYCYNNPLTCVDPSGFSWWTNFRDKWLKPVVAIGIAVFAPQLIGSMFTSFAAASGSTAFATMTFSAAAGTTSAGLTAFGSFATSAISGFAAGAISSGSLQGGLQGAFTAGLFFGAGEVLAAAQVGTAGGVALHGLAGCVSSMVSGGQCGSGALSAAFSKASLPLTAGLDGAERALAHAVIGGTASTLGGGTFANGAVTGAFSYLFNALQHGFGYEYPADVEHPFGPTSGFKDRFFGSQEERQVWFRTQEIATGQAEVREWLRFDDPKIQLPRSGGPLYAIYDLGLDTAGAVRIAWSPKIPNVFYVSLDHYQATPAQPLRWTRFEAAPPKK